MHFTVMATRERFKDHKPVLSSEEFEARYGMQRVAEAGKPALFDALKSGLALSPARAE